MCRFCGGHAFLALVHEPAPTIPSVGSSVTSNLVARRAPRNAPSCEEIELDVVGFVRQLGIPFRVPRDWLPRTKRDTAPARCRRFACVRTSLYTFGALCAGLRAKKSAICENNLAGESRSGLRRRPSQS